MKTLGAGLLLALTGCAESTTGSAGFAAEEDETVLAAAYDACMADDTGDTMELVDEGHSVLIDTGSEGDLDGVVCLLMELDTSERIITQMDSTTAMQGVRSGRDGELFYEWTYHPDNGMDLTVTDES